MTEARGGPKGGAANGGSAGGRPLEDAAQVLPSADDAVVRRTKDGWRVGGAELSDLTSAMVLADLLSAELAASTGGEPGEAEAGPAGTKPRPGARQADRAGSGAAETDATGATGAGPASTS